MDKLRSEGTILEAGYGLIPKVIMRDKNISITAKAIYAYICSYAGAGMTAYPSTGLMCSDLGINKNTYFKHLNMLKDNGYIEVKKNKTDKGQFQNNIYVICSNPCTKKPYTAEPDTVNSYTNSNSVNINSLKSNKKNIDYIILENDGRLFSSLYLKTYRKYIRKKHPTISIDNHMELTSWYRRLQDLITKDEFIEAVDKHFENLPAENNGSILAFKKASFRYFEVPAEE